jgi:hypothetical protein
MGGKIGQINGHMNRMDVYHVWMNKLKDSWADGWKQSRKIFYDYSKREIY